MFAAEFEPVVQDNRRRSPRAAVSLDARLGKGGLSRTLCKVIDISVHGCKLQTYSQIKKGSTISLTLPEIGHVSAEVMWSDDFLAGCQFRPPLPVAAFEAILQANDANN